MSWPQRALKWVAIWLLALVLLFEEWGWERLSALLAWLGRWPGFKQLEALIRRLPPYGALALFAAPVLGLLPVKLLALYWIGQGHTGLGLVVIIAAKLGGTAIVARLFALTHPTLMRLPWFARLFTRWMAFKQRVITQFRSSPAWRAWRAFRQRVGGWARRAWRRWRGG
ncbi:MAG: hypothetical protein RI907_1441 [Pseudomonadota bacterium]